MLIVSLPNHTEDERLLDWIVEILRKRRPRPVKVETLGGNCEPGVLVVANETHFTREKPPRLATWLMKQIRAEFDAGERYRFEVVLHTPPTRAAS